MLQLVWKKDAKMLFWYDAVSVAIANRILVERPSCLLILTGKKITRKILQREKEIFRECGFDLIKVNKFHLEGALHYIFPLSRKYFSTQMCGYPLIAFSSIRSYKPQEIISLFNLPSYYTVTTMVLTHQTLYTAQRLLGQNYFQNLSTQKFSYATSLGLLYIYF